MRRLSSAAVTERSSTAIGSGACCRATPCATAATTQMLTSNGRKRRRTRPILSLFAAQPFPRFHDIGRETGRRSGVGKELDVGPGLACTSAAHQGNADGEELLVLLGVEGGCAPPVRQCLFLTSFLR